MSVAIAIGCLLNLTKIPTKLFNFGGTSDKHSYKLGYCFDGLKLQMKTTRIGVVVESVRLTGW